VVGNWGCGEDEGIGAVTRMKALHRDNSDFSKPPAPSDQMNILLFAFISAGTVGHPALPVTKLGLPLMWCFYTSPLALLLVPWPPCTHCGQRGAPLLGPAIPVPLSAE